MSEATAFQPSYTGAPPPVEMPVFDTESPAYGEVTRFAEADVPKWGTWLLGRLRQRWPTLSDRTLTGQLREFSARNEYLFIKTGNAVALFMQVRDVMNPQPKVLGVFGFYTHRDHQEQLVRLIRHAASWGKRANCRRVTFSEDWDMTPGVIKDRIKGEQRVEPFVDL